MKKELRGALSARRHEAVALLAVPQGVGVENRHVPFFFRPAHPQGAVLHAEGADAEAARIDVRADERRLLGLGDGRVVARSGADGDARIDQTRDGLAEPGRLARGVVVAEDGDRQSFGFG